MSVPPPGNEGVSPVIAVILMVAITVVLAGAVTLWVFNLSSQSGEDGEMYFFRSTLEASDDTIHIHLLSGSDTLDTSKIRVIINGEDVSSISNQEMYAGDELVADAGIDLTPGTTYNVKITVNNRMMYEGNPIANL